MYSALWACIRSSNSIQLNLVTSFHPGYALKPLMRNGKYKNRIIVKKLEVNSYSSIAGFDGRQYRTDQLSSMYNVDLYPTLVFFDANGEEVSQRIVGITVLE